MAEPPLRKMERPIVDHVTPLAQALQIAPVIPGRIVVHMCSRQNDLRGAETHRLDQVRPSAWSPLTRPPGLHLRVIPTSVRQAPHDEAVGSTADLTATLRPLKADDTAYRGPIGRIEIAEIPANWHAATLSAVARAKQGLAG